MRKRKRTSALATAAALAGSAVLLTAPSTRAEVVDVDHACGTPIDDIVSGHGTARHGAPALTVVSGNAGGPPRAWRAVALRADSGTGVS
ncbi:hypothetical protein [Streptomyces nigra]|uniref:hypothetical protein n=1 Tax=Streptomyces nigra TaxID=1827580 RepID=UPI0035E2A9A2